MTRTPLVRAWLTACLTFMVVPAVFAQTPPPRADNQHLQGGWVQTVLHDPGTPQLPPVQPNNALVLFTADGGVMSHNNTVNPPGFLGSGGIGNWARVGNNEFAVTQKFAVAFVDASGGHDVGFFVQRLLLHYGPTTDELSGTADFALVDLNGNVIFAAPFNVVLQRVPVQRVGDSF